MNITSSRFRLVKRHPLTISRGTSTGSENVLVRVEHEGIVGLGEVAPTGVTGDSAESAEADLTRWAEALGHLAPWDLQATEEWCAALGGGSAARAGLDIAMHDWLGRRAGLPLWRLLGLDRARLVPTSVTIGINPPEVIRQLVPEVLGRTGARALKVKLGCPDGLEADRATLAAAQEAAKAAGAAVAWRVDANGGWNLEGAVAMARWLSDRGVELVEQPLPSGQEAGLTALRAASSLPLFADESVHAASDVARVAGRADGVNVKLMKCGGIRDALRLIHTARAHGLRLMLGCMGESSLAITAAAHLSPLVDYVDLDSHLNLCTDPFVGAAWREGRVVPNDDPGLGVREREP